MRRLGPTLAVLVLLASSCELAQRPASVEYAADPAAGEMALEFAGRGDAALVVPVHVNGEGPFQFVLDTGATLTCIDRRIADRLDLPRRSAGGVGADAAGTGAVAIVRTDSLRVGASSATGLDACVLDLAHTEQIGVEIDGLLGLNFLRSFRVTLDFGRNVLRLEEPG